MIIDVEGTDLGGKNSVHVYYITPSCIGILMEGAKRGMGEVMFLYILGIKQRAWVTRLCEQFLYCLA